MKRRDRERLIELRKLLHRHPELSGHEAETARIVSEFIHSCMPDIIVRGLGGNGIACIFKAKRPGLTVAFRGELDALPVEEENQFPHRSRSPKISHACGHDGHMAIVAGLGMRLAQQRPQRGRVVLFFQPAEETGEGAAMMIGDRCFKDLQPDYIFALHNLPDHPLGRILIREGSFSCASRGMIIKLWGMTSHAAYPEKGRSPAQAMAEIIESLSDLPQTSEGFSLVTIIHARLGEVAFGTTPGYAEVMATLRSQDDRSMERLVQRAEDLAGETGERHGLDVEISWSDVFSATLNHPEAVALVERAGSACGMTIEKTEAPFRWSEDFGRFLARYQGALFCMGAGENHAPLHSPHYDFPDDLIEPGVTLFEQIVREILD
jgi:amidohydrolase